MLLVTALASLICRSAIAQRSDTTAVRDRLLDPAPMSAAEIADALQASREALGYASLRLSLTPAGSGPEVLMAPDGRPIFLRTTSVSMSTWWSIEQPQRQPSREERTLGVRLTHYTRHAPQRCDGSFAPGELVVDYEKRGNEWTVSARQWRSASEPFGQVFAMLSAELPLEDIGHAMIGGRQVRGLRAAWSAPAALESGTGRRGGAATPSTRPSAGAVQTLWVDERTFVPLRWTVSVSAPRGSTARGRSKMIESSLFFAYDNSIDLRAPAGIEPPECLDPADDPAVSRPPR